MATGATDPFAKKDRPSRPGRRISETRVLCEGSVLIRGTMLSVDRVTTARPVHERAHAFPRCAGARWIVRSSVVGPEAIMLVLTLKQ